MVAPQASTADGAYRAPWWLGRGAGGGHWQTLYGALWAPRPAVRYLRERWEATPHGKPDGDFIDVDRLAATRDALARPMLLVFHGLEGNSRSQYALNLMAAAQARGWRGMVAHFRGCSGEVNRLPRAYHSGDAAEIDWIVRRVHAESPAAPLYVAAISLGGNATLKWLGEQEREAARWVTAAAAVSAPFDLMAAGEALEKGFCRLYTWNFLVTMKRKSLRKLERHPGIFSAERVQAARTLREFDNAVTAPLHGYRDTDDYWTRASSKPGLVDVRVPALLLNAQNDPFLPAWALPGENAVSRDVIREFPAQGGHVGFMAPAAMGGPRWMARRVLGFFERGQ